MNETKDWNQPYSEIPDWEKLSDKMVELGHLPPREHSEKTEYLSRQHVDFKTPEGMKKLIQSVTRRAKVDNISVLGSVNIYVSKNDVPAIRRLVHEFGISDTRYDVKELKWNECWFKRYQVVDQICESREGIVKGIATDRFEAGEAVYIDPKTGNLVKPEEQWCAFNHGMYQGYAEVFGVERDGDIIQKGAFEKLHDHHSEEVVDGKIKVKRLKRLTSTGRCDAPGTKTVYFVESDKDLKEEMDVLLNGRRFKIQRTINKQDSPNTGISGYFF